MAAFGRAFNITRRSSGFGHFPCAYSDFSGPAVGECGSRCPCRISGNAVSESLVVNSVHRSYGSDLGISDRELVVLVVLIYKGVFTLAGSLQADVLCIATLLCRGVEPPAGNSFSDSAFFLQAVPSHAAFFAHNNNLELLGCVCIESNGSCVELVFGAGNEFNHVFSPACHRAGEIDASLNLRSGSLLNKDERSAFCKFGRSAVFLQIAGDSDLVACSKSLSDLSIFGNSLIDSDKVGGIGAIAESEGDVAVFLGICGSDCSHIAGDGVLLVSDLLVFERSDDFEGLFHRYDSGSRFGSTPNASRARILAFTPSSDGEVRIFGIESEVAGLVVDIIPTHCGIGSLGINADEDEVVVLCGHLTLIDSAINMLEEVCPLSFSAFSPSPGSEEREVVGAPDVGIEGEGESFIVSILYLEIGYIDLNSAVVDSYTAEHGVFPVLVEGERLFPVVAELYFSAVESNCDVGCRSSEGSALRHLHVAEHEDFVHVSSRDSSRCIGNNGSSALSDNELVGSRSSCEFGQSVVEFGSTGDAADAVTSLEGAIVIIINERNAGSVLHVDVGAFGKNNCDFTESHLSVGRNGIDISASAVNDGSAPCACLPAGDGEIGVGEQNSLIACLIPLAACIGVVVLCACNDCRLSGEAEENHSCGLIRDFSRVDVLLFSSRENSCPLCGHAIAPNPCSEDSACLVPDTGIESEGAGLWSRICPFSIECEHAACLRGIAGKAISAVVTQIAVHTLCLIADINELKTSVSGSQCPLGKVITDFIHKFNLVFGAIACSILPCSSIVKSNDIVLTLHKSNVPNHFFVRISDKFRLGEIHTIHTVFGNGVAHCILAVGN